MTALVFRGGSAIEKITPARAVGEAFVTMDRSDRKIDVAIEAPKQMKPETDLPVTVKAPALAGKKAYVTVSAVDVGILNITRFARPDANEWFFAQRALGVDAYDLYGRVIESFDGNTAKLRYGGDMALAALPQARRPTAKVLTVDLFSGAVALDAKGEAKVALKVPDFNGTVRVTALVFGEDQYGGADAETIVRAPLVAEISTPRVMAPGDAGAADARSAELLRQRARVRRQGRGRQAARGRAGRAQGQARRQREDDAEFPADRAGRLRRRQDQRRRADRARSRSIAISSSPCVPRGRPCCARRRARSTSSSRSRSAPTRSMACSPIRSTRG